MDFSFTEEQSILRDAVAGYLADHYSFEARRKATASEAGWRPEVWKAFAEELGILGAALPEDAGGLGGGPVETMIIMEEFGKALVVEPYLATVVIGGGFLSRAGRADLLGRVIAGELILAYAGAEPQSRYNLADVKTAARKDGAGYVLDGAKAVVLAAPWADQLIVAARTSGGQRDAEGISLFLVDKAAAGVSTRDYPTVDGARASEVRLEGVRVGADAVIGQEGEGLPLIEQVLDEAIVALCAEGCGVLRRLHELTLEYTKQRKQFGQPISSFQVLQHRMVDMYVQLEQSVSMTAMAAIRVADPDPVTRGKSVSAAKVQLGKALRFVGQNAIQLHGGMGMTDEMAVGHYFKRATLIESALGNTDHHLARYERLSMG
jgi:alkylation response protein AidB-like acyl-CoA dehydrogenase